MKVFLDTNVVLDFLLAREGFYEDALQYFSALGSGTDILLTRNVGDYDFDGIAISTPKDFIASQSK